MRPRASVIASSFALALLLAVASCGPRARATEEDCRLILDRIVDIELGEMGFDDPALAARKRAELAAKLASEMSGCVGRPLPDDARRCLARATTSEEVSHTCLH